MFVLPATAADYPCRRLTCKANKKRSAAGTFLRPNVIKVPHTDKQHVGRIHLTVQQLNSLSLGRSEMFIATSAVPKISLL